MVLLSCGRVCRRLFYRRPLQQCKGLFFGLNLKLKTALSFPSLAGKRKLQICVAGEGLLFRISLQDIGPMHHPDLRPPLLREEGNVSAKGRSIPSTSDWEGISVQKLNLETNLSTPPFQGGEGTAIAETGRVFFSEFHFKISVLCTTPTCGHPSSGRRGTSGPKESPFPPLLVGKEFQYKS